jgi:hypothetical protein
VDLLQHEVTAGRLSSGRTRIMEDGGGGFGWDLDAVARGWGHAAMPGVAHGRDDKAW